MLKFPLLKFEYLKLHLITNYEIKTKFHQYINDCGHIKIVDITTQNNNIPRYLYQDINTNPGKIDTIDIALSFHDNSFITGYKMFSFLEWTEYIPKVIHVNYIRNSRVKNLNNSLDDSVIQKIAFKPKRQSKNIIQYNNTEIVILNGQSFNECSDFHFLHKNTFHQIPQYSKVLAPERVIIEALINYHYFGGADTVWDIGLNQFQNLDLDKLIKIFEEMKLIYPYSNAIGYWMEVAGVSSDILSYWEKNVNKKIRFHLFMGDKERRIWMNKWNLYVPKRFS